MKKIVTIIAAVACISLIVAYVSYATRINAIRFKNLRDNTITVMKLDYADQYQAGDTLMYVDDETHEYTKILILKTMHLD